MSVLILSDADVRGALEPAACIEAMSEALLALQQGEITMPLRSVMRSPGQELFGLMPAHRASATPRFTLKEIVIAPENAARGLDPHQGAVIVHNGVTGRIEAILNASAVTEIRTAAVSALATRLLARPDSSQVAILGSGVQGRSHAEAMRVVLPEAELRIWSRTPANAEALALEAHGVACETVEEALAGADVVCTCTSSREPLVELAMLAPGAHVNAVGSANPRGRELATDVVAAGTLFVDLRESAFAEAGDYLLAAAEAGFGPKHIVAELGELLAGVHPGRTRPDELTIFKSLGVAAEDLVAADLVVGRARELGLGVEVDF